MKPAIINFGSINIDHVYRVPHIVTPGETLASYELSTGLGGKGANQSAALARAGASVTHIGRVSRNDQWAVNMLGESGVNVENIELVEEVSGHAIIQVDKGGENAIVLCGGANQSFAVQTLKSIIRNAAGCEYFLMQNECNLLPEAFEIAHAKGLKIALNPAPMTESIKALPLELLDTLIVNQGEAEALCSTANIDGIIRELSALAPNTRTVITLGADGAILLCNGEITRVDAVRTEVTDSTGAGDTFVGYFLAGLLDGLGGAESVHRACQAAAISVTRKGALSSIPALAEVCR